MAKLNDTQLILLSHAAQRDSGSFYPLPKSLADAGTRATRTLATLMKAGLAEDREISDADATYRSDGDIRHGLFITPTGREAIGLDGAAGRKPTKADAAKGSPPAPPRLTKAALVLDLLRREGGATLAELVEATGWLPHTTRAALTGLRKKGHAVERVKRGDATCYRIGGAA